MPHQKVAGKLLKSIANPARQKLQAHEHNNQPTIHTYYLSYPSSPRREKRNSEPGAQHSRPT